MIEARAPGATRGRLRLWSLYVPNGRSPGSPHHAYKLRWLAALRDAVAPEVAAGGAFLAVGEVTSRGMPADICPFMARSRASYRTGVKSGTCHGVIRRNSATAPLSWNAARRCSSRRSTTSKPASSSWAAAMAGSHVA